MVIMRCLIFIFMLCISSTANASDEANSSTDMGLGTTLEAATIGSAEGDLYAKTRWIGDPDENEFLEGDIGGGKGFGPIGGGSRGQGSKGGSFVDGNKGKPVEHKYECEGYRVCPKNSEGLGASCLKGTTLTYARCRCLNQYRYYTDYTVKDGENSKTISGNCNINDGKALEKAEDFCELDGIKKHPECNCVADNTVCETAPGYGLDYKCNPETMLCDKNRCQDCICKYDNAVCGVDEEYDPSSSKCNGTVHTRCRCKYAPCAGVCHDPAACGGGCKNCEKQGQQSDGGCAADPEFRCSKSLSDETCDSGLYLEPEVVRETDSFGCGHDCWTGDCYEKDPCENCSCSGTTRETCFPNEMTYSCGSGCTRLKCCKPTGTTNNPNCTCSFNPCYNDDGTINESNKGEKVGCGNSCEAQC